MLEYVELETHFHLFDPHSDRMRYFTQILHLTTVSVFERREEEKIALNPFWSRNIVRATVPA